MNPYLILLCAALAAFGWWQFDRANEERAERVRIEKSLDQVKSNEKTAAAFTGDVAATPSAGTIGRRLERVCHILPTLPDQPRADGAAVADAADRLPDRTGGIAGRLSEELRRVRVNQAKLDRLHQQLQPQVE